MKKESVKITVYQSVRDTTSSHSENWQHETEAEYYSLSTYQKIIYQDIEQRIVNIKWYNENKQLEIFYGTIKLFFNLEINTPLAYTTPEGNFFFEVKTDQLIISDKEIMVNYQLILENNPIGDYHFRLIYRQ